MDANEYLRRVLQDQTLADDGPEMKALREEREAVESLLREEFESCNPTIRYGGSKAKGTMNKESYDLDIPCYFEHDDDGAGETLEEIFNNSQKALQKRYIVQPKTSALRLLGASDKNRGVYVHVDVVPGRFCDDQKEDCFLYVANGEKCRLKTNLQVQIDHIRDSGRREAIRLSKLWKVRNGIQVKTFALELAVIEILSGSKASASLDAQMTSFWTKWRDAADEVQIEDPANPTGNDLSDLLNDGIRLSLSAAAGNTLRQIDDLGWEAVFGRLPEDENKQASRRIEILTRSAAAYGTGGTKPWLDVR